ncbi:MAG: FIST C-terminal domain-containing protein [Bacteroidales bacterium]|nr:FIST C-terminal domain-containing protein [Bacteroidales bacterium]
MKVKTAYSQKKDWEGIISDLKSQIGLFDAKFIQFYASSIVDPKEISQWMYEAFNNVPIIGCTTSGEIVSGKMLDNSVVLMAMGEEIVADCKIEVLTDIKTDTKAVEKAFASFEKYYSTGMHALDTQSYVGLVLIDGLSVQEEKINERIGDLTNVTFIGGSAGDDLKFEKTFVYANGQYHSNAAVLALLKCNTSFDVLKTQSFKSTKTQVLVTKADEANRTVMELNGKPAVTEYLSLLKVDQEKVDTAFFRNPLGLVFEDDFFVRSPQKKDGDNIVFYCSIKEGMGLDILESQDIVEQTKKDLDEKIKLMGEVSAIINFNCILRTLELKDKNQTEAYGQLFSDIPTVGFSTYGESYIGHMNQTATMLLFK